MTNTFNVAFYIKDESDFVRRIVISGFPIEDIADLAKEYQKRDPGLQGIKNLKHTILDS